MVDCPHIINTFPYIAAAATAEKQRRMDESRAGLNSTNGSFDVGDLENYKRQVDVTVRLYFLVTCISKSRNVHINNMHPFFIQTPMFTVNLCYR